MDFYRRRRPREDRRELLPVLERCLGASSGEGHHERKHLWFLGGPDVCCVCAQEELDESFLFSVFFALSSGKGGRERVVASWWWGRFLDFDFC